MRASWTDRLGGVASTVCALHCLVSALAPALLLLLGIGAAANELLEWGLFALAIGLAIPAAILGRLAGVRAWVSIAFALGAVALVSGRLAEASHRFEGGGVLAVIGGALLVFGHLGNLRHGARRASADAAPSTAA